MATFVDEYIFFLIRYLCVSSVAILNGELFGEGRAATVISMSHVIAAVTRLVSHNREVRRGTAV